MYEWSDEHNMLRQAMKDFIAKELIPIREELEHGDLPPYDLLRKMFKNFGMDEMARANFDKRIARDKAIEAGELDPSDQKKGGGMDPGFSLIPTIELCRQSPGVSNRHGCVHGAHSCFDQ